MIGQDDHNTKELISVFSLVMIENSDIFNSTCLDDSDCTKISKWHTHVRMHDPDDPPICVVANRS